MTELHSPTCTYARTHAQGLVYHYEFCGLTGVLFIEIVALCSQARCSYWGSQSMHAGAPRIFCESEVVSKVMRQQGSGMVLVDSENPGCSQGQKH